MKICEDVQNIQKSKPQCNMASIFLLAKFLPPTEDYQDHEPWQSNIKICKKIYRIEHSKYEIEALSLGNRAKWVPKCEQIKLCLKR